MVADWYEAVTLSSEWFPSAESPAFYRLTLSNHGQESLTGFQLGASGPAFVIGDAALGGGRVVTQLSNYCEFAPPTPDAASDDVPTILRVIGALTS